MPTAVCTYCHTLFACDTSNKAIRMIRSARGLIPYQCVTENYTNVFKLDKKMSHSKTLIFSEYLKCVEDIVSFFQQHEECAFNRTGKRNTNGPNMTISRTTLTVGNWKLSRMSFKSLTTPSVDSFLRGCVLTMTCQQCYCMDIGGPAMCRII